MIVHYADKAVFLYKVLNLTVLFNRVLRALCRR